MAGRKAEVARFLGLAEAGATLIGGFISPGEKEVAKGVLEIKGAKVIESPNRDDGRGGSLGGS